MASPGRRRKLSLRSFSFNPYKEDYRAVEQLAEQENNTVAQQLRMLLDEALRMRRINKAERDEMQKPLSRIHRENISTELKPLKTEISEIANALRNLGEEIAHIKAQTSWTNSQLRQDSSSPRVLQEIQLEYLKTTLEQTILISALVWDSYLMAILDDSNPGAIDIDAIKRQKITEAAKKTEALALRFLRGKRV